MLKPYRDVIRILHCSFIIQIHYLLTVTLNNTLLLRHITRLVVISYSDRSVTG